MFGLSKLLRAGEGRTVKRLGKMADDVIALEDKYAELSDEELKAKTDEFKTRLKDGEEMNDILLEAFATVREAAWRVLDQKHYRVQIMGGAAAGTQALGWMSLLVGVALVIGAVMIYLTPEQLGRAHV